MPLREQGGGWIGQDAVAGVQRRLSIRQKDLSFKDVFGEPLSFSAI
jgi:hypothetical protein